MARVRTVQRRPRSTIIGATAVVAVLALLTTLAVTAEGYDAQETPRLDTSVWVVRDDGQYARVNTDLGEIDTVRSVDDPSNVIQLGADAYVLTQNDRLLWPVDAASPLDFTTTAASDSGDGDAAAPTKSANTPQGTRSIATAGSYVVYLTDANTVFLGRLPGADAIATADPSVVIGVDPFAEVEEEDEEDAPVYSATAVTVSPTGIVALYSAEEEAVRLFDAGSGTFTGDPIPVQDAPAEDELLELAMVGDSWILSSPADARVWIEGQEPISTGLGASAVLQSTSAEGDSAYLADQDGLVSIDLTSGDVTAEADASGAPARPIVVDGVAYAAWLESGSGELWSSDSDDTVNLEVPEGELDDVQSIVPVIRSNGQRAVLTETSSGLLWTVPDGTLIPLEQWSIDDQELNTGTIEVDDVAEQEPPTAVADTLGVRRGELVRLPLLLNDHDPNMKDVLSIDPASISGLDNPAFGEIGLVSNNQEAVVRVRADSGTATFSYAVTDGLEKSAPVLVTLTIAPDDQNTAPVWCGVNDCAQVWPTPQVAPGGTITVPVLTGWVDPEGDALVLTDARKDNSDDPITVVPKADGSVAIRHLDPNVAGGTIPITVTISDSRGLSTVKTLELTVTSSPALVVAPVAVVAGIGEKRIITIADHVFGGSGSYRLLDASTTADGLLVVPNTAAGTVELSAATVGEFLLTYTVQDSITLAEQSAVARISVLGEVPLTMAPITTFVRTNEDTTVDVLGAVQNTTGRVLLVSSAITGDPALSVSVVGQSAVRVSGGTADGLPGKIGTAIITITDGAGAIVEGTLTVFLAPPSTGVGAIAVPDTATVRAGGQVDIPVTDNDVSPRGERLLVHPTVETSKASGELAFVAGDIVRYVAPTEEGVYTVRYSVYLGNEPARLDTTTITITVVAGGSNRPPQPPILEARVLSGQTVTIPVDGYSMDPDGDEVVLASVTQPEVGQGVASISGDGTAIVYTATGNGISGAQVSFDYTVRDSEGAEAVGAVRVGVLDADIADSAPITYSDYIRAQKGASTPITVLPMLNDSDPADGELELISLVPNTPALETNPEYARLESLIDASSSIETGTIQLNAGTVLGTHSYIYTVQSSISTSTSQGLIVVTVADEGALDYPEVADTVLTAKNRNQLSKGIDVVNGKVQWPTGDTSKLKLKLWGAGTGGYSVSGQSISGSLPKNGAVITFSLTGEDAAGNDVVSYGFLRIPAFDDMRLQLKPVITPIEVEEEKSIEFDILDVLDIDASESVSIRDDDAFVVQRANSSCVSSGSTSATYSAGREAPYTDFCAVPVRLQGQTKWTILTVPITIAPKDPLAQLNAVTRTIAPGSSESVDLYESMTSWQGGRVGDTSILDYAATYAGSSFIVTQTAGVVSVEARADAKPGTRETVQVSISSYGGLTSAITLVVGIAAPDTPRGATFSKQCVVSAGPSCSITVIGQPGEYDPFAGKVGSGLTLVSVGTGAPVSCAVATIAVSGATSLVATYPAGPKPAGGQCIVPYTIKDAQGRTGVGQVTIDIQGYPAKPQSLTTQSYSATGVVLAVTLGEAALAYPSLTSVKIFENGVAVATCTPGSASYQCAINGLVNGEQHTYTARATNAVGDSLDTTPVTTNAYETPTITSFTARSIYEAGLVTTGNARVELTINGGSGTTSFRVVHNGYVQTKAPTGATVFTVDIPAGSPTVQVVPQSAFTPPSGGNGDGAIATAPINNPGTAAIGKPSFTSGASAVPVSSSRIRVDGAGFNANSSSTPSVTYIAWRDGTDAAPTCTVGPTGDLVVGGGGTRSVNANEFNVPTKFVTYSVMVCGTNKFGIAEPALTTSVYAGILPAAPANGPSYRVATDRGGSGNTYTFALQNAPGVANPSDPDFQTIYRYGNQGTESHDFTLSEGANPGQITVKYCAISAPGYCTAAVNVFAQTSATISTVVLPSLGTDETCIVRSTIEAKRAAMLTSGIISAGEAEAVAEESGGGFLGSPTTRVQFYVDFDGDTEIDDIYSTTFDICSD